MLPTPDLELTCEDSLKLATMRMLAKEVSREELEKMFLDAMKQSIIYKKLFVQQLTK
jgi:hypothetical protein